MSTLPLFIKDQRDNPIWNHLNNYKKSWLEKKIRFILKNESISIRYVYGYLRYVDVNNRGFAYPSQATISRAVKITPRHVIRCLKRLIELDLIIKGKKGNHSYYIFTLPSSIKEKKDEIKENLEQIDKEVKDLKDKSLKFHLEEEFKTSPKKDTHKCHINKIKNKIKNKAETNPPKKIKKINWFEWIKSKESIKLTDRENSLLKQKEQSLLTFRKKKYPFLPEKLLEKNIGLICLGWLLKKEKNLSYTQDILFLNKEL